MIVQNGELYQISFPLDKFKAVKAIADGCAKFLNTYSDAIDTAINQYEYKGIEFSVTIENANAEVFVESKDIKVLQELEPLLKGIAH
jgi:hypothetical protein